MTLLQLELSDNRGQSNISVTGFSPTLFPELEWAFKFPGEGMSKAFRNVALLPLKISNPGKETWVCPVTREDMPDLFGLHDEIEIPFLKGAVIIELLDNRDNSLRYVETSCVWAGFVSKDGTAVLEPGQSFYAFNNRCWLDKTGVRNGPPGYDPLPESEYRTLSISLNPKYNWMANIWEQVRIGSGELMLRRNEPPPKTK